MYCCILYLMWRLWNIYVHMHAHICTISISICIELLFLAAQISLWYTLSSARQTCLELVQPPWLLHTCRFHQARPSLLGFIRLGRPSSLLGSIQKILASLPVRCMDQVEGSFTQNSYGGKFPRFQFLLFPVPTVEKLLRSKLLRCKKSPLVLYISFKLDQPSSVLDSVKLLDTFLCNV
jgi:hypothetical protein